MEDIDELKKIRDMLRNGKAEDAIGKLHVLEEKCPKSANVLVNLSGILIDAGQLLDDPSMISRGIASARNSLKMFDNKKETRNVLMFYIANGYLDISQVKSQQGSEWPTFYNEDLQKAKRFFRELVITSGLEPDLEKRIWTNYGNLLDILGRGFEALGCYERVLQLDSDFSMALGNKGIALEFFAALSGQHIKKMLIDAYWLLDKALANTEEIRVIGGNTASSRFSDTKNRIAGHFPNGFVPNRAPVASEESQSNLEPSKEHDYEQFCCSNDLFLNFCSGCIECVGGLSDPLYFQTLTTSIDDKNRFPILATYLNQIKEDYIAARWLLFQYVQDNAQLARIARMTSFADAMNGSNFSLRDALLKTSYEESADILDKIAGFINLYLGLGKSPSDVHFTNVWHKDKHKTMRNEIAERVDNSPLRGLFDMYLDWIEEKGDMSLRNLRNSLTHRYVALHDISPLPEDTLPKGTHISERDFYEKTVEMMHFARSALVYLVCIVRHEEAREHRDSGNGRYADMLFHVD